MKEEVLRLDRVTCLDQGVIALNHFSLNVFAGEIMGLIPVNSTGLASLIQLLRQNVPIHYGYVYYREQLVNHWEHADGRYNRISVISGTSGLAGDLTVADNVFVLRQGFKKRVIARGILRRQLSPFLAEIGVQISADTYAKDLTSFERFVVEIVKAVVAGNRLIILVDTGTIISDAELSRLHGILRHYAAAGVSFLYISQHYEEIRQICDRVALMTNGQIAKVLGAKESSEAISTYEVKDYERLVRTQGVKRAAAGGAPKAALSIRSLYSDTLIGLNLAIAPGECVVLQDLDSRVLEPLLKVLTRQKKPQSGAVCVGGVPYGRQNARELAVIQKMATQTMLFPELSYLDNLCFTMDHRLAKVWLHPKARESIRDEYSGWLGQAVFDKTIDELTPLEKYDLIYARILLQRPKVVICVQPFMQADVAQRMHIWQLLERLLSKQIAVVILAVNLADTLSLADRLVRMQNGHVLAVYDRSAFGSLPADTPWHHLWDSEAGKGGAAQAE